MVDSKIDEGNDSLQNALNKLYHSRKHHDLEIVCGGLTWKCHSWLFWTRSKFFAAALNGGFSEATSRRLEFPEDNPHLFLKLDSFAYLSDYDDSGYTNQSPNAEHAYVSKLHTNAELYAIGEKYDFKALKTLALTKFDAALKETTPASGQHHIFSLVPLIYATTPESDRGMRDRVVEYVAANAKQLSSVPGFSSMVAENPDFVVEVFGKTVAPKAFPPCTKACGRCIATNKYYVVCSCGWVEHFPDG